MPLVGRATDLFINSLVNDVISQGDSGLLHMEPIGVFSLSWGRIPVTIARLVT